MRLGVTSTANPATTRSHPHCVGMRAIAHPLPAPWRAPARTAARRIVLSALLFGIIAPHSGIDPARAQIHALCGGICAFAHPVRWAQRATAPAQAEDGDRAAALAKINALRRANDAPPLTRNAQLEDAALRHARDMAARGFVDITGSDGSSVLDRVRASGYPQWPDQRVYAESIFAGQTTFDEALAFFAGDEQQRVPLLSPRFREIGIGIASDGVRTYWTLTYGSQPNVLPLFLNDGADVTGNAQVTVLLPQERAVPGGGDGIIGEITEVRLSDDPAFPKAGWQPWQPVLTFRFDRSPGEKTLYVEMKDIVGQTAISSARIRFDPKAPAATVVAVTAEATSPPVPPLTPFAPEATTADAAATITQTQTAERPAPTASAARVVAASTAVPLALPAPTQIPEGAPAAQERVEIALAETAPVTAALPEPTPQSTARAFLTARDEFALPGWLLALLAAIQLGVLGWALVRFIGRQG